jgi:UDP-glucose 4-epimerase
MMLRHHVKTFIFSSTAAVYGEPKAKLMNELHQIVPITPYGRSKVMVEQVLRDLARSSGLRYGILRYFNAAGADPEGRLGERHSAESHLIPLLLQAAAGKRKNITIYGNHHATQDGTCVRDYVHVVDICQAHLLVLQQLLKDKAEMTFNVGTGHGYSVLQVIRAVERITGMAIQKMIGSARPGDPATLVADPQRIKEELGWSPRYPDLDAMIHHAWQYIKKIN